MEIGVCLPRPRGSVPHGSGDLSAFARSVEAMGFDYLTCSEHILNADMRQRHGTVRAAAGEALWHEPLTLFSFLAASTGHIRFMTSVLVLPLRQTALVAKQVAEVDILSGGRLRLGFGVGWNEPEFSVLGADFHTRGRRIEEQITVLRALWTQEIVSFQGRWHRISGAGINPLPVQRPVPIWLGGDAETAIRRAARLADGWMPEASHDEIAPAIERFYAYAIEAGRDPAGIGVAGRIRLASGDLGDWVSAYARWRDLGATHIELMTNSAAHDRLEDHLPGLEQFLAAVKVRG